MATESKLVRCKKCDHYYDTAVHDTCPYCESGKYPTRIIRNNTNYNPTEVVEKPFDPYCYWTSYPPYMELCLECHEYYDKREHDTCPRCIPVGWLEAIGGPHKGEKFKIRRGYNYIGREVGEIQLPNDRQIIREKHALVVYNSKDSSFYFGPTGWKIVKLNGCNAYNCEQIHTGDVMEVGETKLVLISLEDARGGEESLS